MSDMQWLEENRGDGFVRKRRESRFGYQKLVMGRPKNIANGSAQPPRRSPARCRVQRFAVADSAGFAESARVLSALRGG